MLQRLHKEFPNAPSSQRMVELIPRCAMAMAAFFHTLKGNCSKISTVDSTPLAVCDNLRIRQHKVFAGLAAMGKRSTRWFLGFKLHAVIDPLGEQLAIHLTLGNVDDRKPLPS